MSGMKKLNSWGRIDPLIIPLILVSLLLVAAGGFGIWAYMSRQDYKDNSDQKAAAAVEVAEQKTSTAKDNEFAEKEKLPLKDYAGPAAYGSVVVKYPKTWSAYVSEKSSGNAPIDGYFHPGFVPAVDGKISYALRMQVVNTNYVQALKQYDSRVKNGSLKAAAYVPAKQQTVTGTRFDGQVETDKTGVLIVLPLRDKTLKIWTESTDFINDFNNNILPNFTFEQ